MRFLDCARNDITNVFSTDIFIVFSTDIFIVISTDIFIVISTKRSARRDLILHHRHGA